MHNPIVSVIVPVYNAEETIHKCVNSILNQSYDNYEIILIDDGSTDASYKYCYDFAQNNDKVQLVQQANAGASVARNAGIRIANGDWIVFVDSDDTTLPQYIEDLVNPVQKSDVDWVISGLQNVTLEGQIIKVKRLKNEVININDISKNDFIQSVIQNKGPCCKLYRKALLEEFDIQFPIGLSASEDFCFNLLYFKHCKKIQLIDSVNYNYIKNSSSLVSKIWPLEKEINLNKILDEIIGSYENVFNTDIIKILEEYRCTLLFRALNSIYEYISDKNIRIHEIKELQKIKFRQGVSFNNLYFEHNIKLGILHSLLKFKLYNLYDFIRFRFT